MGVLERERAALGELAGDRLDALAGDPRERAGRSERDGEVGETADAGVEGGAGQLGAVQRADHRERREVDADRPQAGLASGVEQALDHVAPRGDDDDARPRAVRRLDDTQRVMLEHGLLERHRDVVGSLEADRGVDLLGALERRKVEGAHHDALVGDAQAHALAELVLGEQVTERGGERLDVDDLAVTDDAGGERRGGGALDLHLARARLDGSHVAGLDVEADD